MSATKNYKATAGRKSQNYYASTIYAERKYRHLFQYIAIFLPRTK